MAKLLHGAMVACLVILAIQFQLGLLSVAGIVLVLSLLIYEHSLVRPTDLSRVNVAFFTLNGYISILFFLFWAGDILLHKRLI